MINVILAREDNPPFLDMIETLETQDITVDQAGSGESALRTMQDAAYDLLITGENLPDMTGRELVEKTVMKNPLINCVAVSSLSPEAFHEAYEGLGVLMQFPPTPDTADVEKLLYHLNKIYALSRK